MAKRLRIENPLNFDHPVQGGLTGTIAGLIRFRTTRYTRRDREVSVYIKGLAPAGNPKPTYRFPKGQSGNPNYRP